MSTIKKIVSDLKKTLQTSIEERGLNGRQDIPQLFLSNESMDESARSVAVAGVETLKEVVEQATDMVLSNESISITPAQRKAAQSIAAIALNPKMGLEAIGSPKMPAVSNEAAQVTPADLGIADVVDFGELSTEAFDGQSLNNTLYFSIIANMFAAKQDEFGETFFPTIAIDPDVAGITIGTEVVSLYKNFTRTEDGAPVRNKFQKVTLAKAIYDNELMGGDRNKLVPVLRDDNRDKLIAELSHADTSTGEEITTAPIKAGITINLPGISQTDAMLSRGAMDAYDTLDRAVRLDTVVAKLTGKDSDGNDVTEYFRIPVGMLPYSNFTYTTQGHEKDLALNFESSDIAFLTSETKTWDGSASTILAGLPQGYKVKIHMKITGDGNTQYGDISVYPTLVELDSIYDASGNRVSSTASEYTAIKDVMDTLAVVGYEIDAYLTNSNLRTEGQLVTIDRFEQIYTVPVRSGVSVVVPIKSTGNDDSRLIGQVQTIGYRMSLEAVETLVNFTNNLESLTANGANTDVALMGVGRRHVDAYFESKTIHLPTMVDSESSSERRKDIAAALWSQISDIVYRAYTESKYNVAHAELRGSSDAPVGVIIGTSSRIKNYLMAEGQDTVELGNNFVVKVVATPNKRIGDFMYITFANHMSSDRNTTPDPISFGQCIWAPTLTTDVATTINGATVRKLQTHPRYLHIVNLPVVMRVQVTGIESVLGKVALNTHSV